MTTGRDDLTKAKTVTIAAIESGVPALVEAREIVAAFHVVIRRSAKASFQPWITRARESLVSSFANGIGQDQAAVLAAITSPRSSGQVEGQISKLKLVKRQMYGRANSICSRRASSPAHDQLHQICVRAPLPCRLTPVSVITRSTIMGTLHGMAGEVMTCRHSAALVVTAQPESLQQVRPLPYALLKPVRSPESNGVSEAFVKTLKRDYARIHPRPDALTVLQQMRLWIIDYNESHPHSGLRMRSPHEFIRSQSQPATCPV